VTLTKQLEQLVLTALLEDLAGGDLTTEATIDARQMAVASAVSKSELVLSGTDVFSMCFHAVHPGCRVECLALDGDLVAPGTEVLRAEGPARALLMAERTALNFLQHLSGIATLTRQFVGAVGGRARIADTRKTTPGLRVLERQAVRHGGGHNHRNDLGSAVLIKDNHIAAAGGVTLAVQRARAYAPHTSKIEVEVTSQSELAEALAARADVIMLDHFDDDAVQAAVSEVGGRALLEVSGNVTLERASRLAHFGVDVISVGALTHSAPAADISLRLHGLPPGSRKGA
jgi:nicotinate-nucleotide pyrophosphorylase (carboxylating)